MADIRPSRALLRRVRIERLHAGDTSGRTCGRPGRPPAEPVCPQPPACCGMARDSSRGSRLCDRLASACCGEGIDGLDAFALAAPLLPLADQRSVVASRRGRCAAAQAVLQARQEFCRPSVDARRTVKEDSGSSRRQVDRSASRDSADNVTDPPSARRTEQNPPNSPRGLHLFRPGSRRCPGRAFPCARRRRWTVSASTSSTSSEVLLARFCPPVSLLAIWYSPPHRWPLPARP